MSETKTVNVQYYAVLREERGESEERVDTQASTAAALYEELRARHGFSLEAKQMRVVVNENFSPWESTINPGDTVVFIPPVAGG